MAFRNQIALLIVFLFPASLFAARITGTATNGTSNRPAAGDEVVLLSLAGGMDETAHTKTDAQGHFTFDAPDEGVQHLVRVMHQSVNYFRMVPPGTTTAEITVYDAAAQVPNIIHESRTFRLQASGGQLEVAEAFTLRNESQPPRTKTGPQAFEVLIPDGAQLTDGMVAGPGGMPTTSMPVALGKKNHYAFNYAIKPGLTQFQVSYKLSYNGSHEFIITPDAPIAELGVLLPRGMKFNGPAGNFAAAGEQGGMSIFAARSITAGQQVKFSVSGEGLAPRESQGGMPGGDLGSNQPGTPGGGLGAPINAPAPLASSGPFIIGVFLAVLAGGAFLLVRRSMPAKAQSLSRDAPMQADSSPHGFFPGPPTPARGASPNSMLDVLKEELFQLESDRLHEKISQREYEISKAGLDALLRRHMQKN